MRVVRQQAGQGVALERAFGLSGRARAAGQQGEGIMWSVYYLCLEAMACLYPIKKIYWGIYTHSAPSGHGPDSASLKQKMGALLPMK